MISRILYYVIPRVSKNFEWTKLGMEDPYFEHIPVVTDTYGNVRKYRRIKRRIPEGISENDSRILQSFRQQAYRYDYWFSIWRISFGWNSLARFIPMLGPFITAYWSLSLLLSTWKLDGGFPWQMQLLFVVNFAIDFFIGSIPFVGLVFEIGYKANSRNCLLLEKHLIKVGQRNQNMTIEDESEDEREWQELRILENLENENAINTIESEQHPKSSIAIDEQTSEHVLDLLHKGTPSRETETSTIASSVTAPSTAIDTSVATVPSITVTSSVALDEPEPDSLRKRGEQPSKVLNDV
ncbi:uncharacterized protein SPAPADRAFT_138508 [Spathaspora passalidarum NRRL Y-27907]|uniref:Uncharacterized protein n=1 Tax=Spathaspora passalidarum (strain NRRL Y-27907 / 11-Y1) TaxID=619300 RepID=G3AN96_SPAPN|nr:uncharacterized protein SPAPADRAFT_138508 [Spathaspora passalidarum NRRL Y-27907]EGW32479.1 hypothetical protein SPAPADRAFT_138508 [Spathaspora passalidarum NRRL Y-27907]